MNIIPIVKKNRIDLLNEQGQVKGSIAGEFNQAVVSGDKVIVNTIQGQVRIYNINGVLIKILQ